MEITLPPEIGRQLAALVKAQPRAGYSAGVERLLIDAGFVTEMQVAELSGDQLSTVQSRRARGHMPEHFKFGSLVCYRAADIAAQIEAGQVVRRNRTATSISGDLLGAA